METEHMASGDQVGSRLVITQIDHYARTDPSRVWATIPIDDNDLSKGFQDITYSDFAKAVDAAALWLQNTLPPAKSSFGTIAYAGPKDVRYPILAVAAGKVERKLLLFSPFANDAAQAHLLKSSNCTALLYGGSSEPTILKLFQEQSDGATCGLRIPELSEWLWQEGTPTFSFSRTADEIRNNPWLIFHTSGTTGLPKLLTYTHGMMASLDTAELMPDANEVTMNRHFENRRWYTPLPSLHFVGMTVVLQFPVLVGGVVVLGPATPGPASPQIIKDIIRYGQVQGVVLPPIMIDGLCADPEGLKVLKSLDYIYFAGAPMTPKTAMKLIPHVPIKPAMGSTEAGAYFLRITGDDDWEYYSFRPGMGMQLQPVSSDLYEAVFVRDPSVEKWQQVFQMFPELSEFRTKDLYSRHPTKPDFWKCVGRADDMIAFSNGGKLHPTELEAEVTDSHPAISAVLIGGQGRPRPWLIVEWKETDLDDTKKQELLSPLLVRANRTLADLVKLDPKLVISARNGRNLVRTGKGSVARKESEMLLQDDIASLYKE